MSQFWTPLLCVISLAVSTIDLRMSAGIALLAFVASGSCFLLRTQAFAKQDLSGWGVVLALLVGTGCLGLLPSFADLVYINYTTSFAVTMWYGNILSWACWALGYYSNPASRIDSNASLKTKFLARLRRPLTKWIFCFSLLNAGIWAIFAVVMHDTGKSASEILLTSPYFDIDNRTAKIMLTLFYDITIILAGSLGSLVLIVYGFWQSHPDNSFNRNYLRLLTQSWVPLLCIIALAVSAIDLRLSTWVALLAAITSIFRVIARNLTPEALDITLTLHLKALLICSFVGVFALFGMWFNIIVSLCYWGYEFFCRFRKEMKYNAKP